MCYNLGSKIIIFHPFFCLINRSDMTRFYFFILTILFFSVNNTDSRQLIYESGGELTPDLASFNVTHYDLTVKINTADSTVAGYVHINFNIAQPNKQTALPLEPCMDL